MCRHCAQAFWVLWAMMKQPKFDLEGVMGAGLRKALCWFYCVDALVKSRSSLPVVASSSCTLCVVPHPVISQCPGYPRSTPPSQDLTALVRVYTPRTGSSPSSHGSSKCRGKRASTYSYAVCVCSTCPFSFVAKVWDSFFLEGWPVIFSTALAIL